MGFSKPLFYMIYEEPSDWITSESDLTLILSNLSLLFLAFLFALPTAINRERSATFSRGTDLSTGFYCIMRIYAYAMTTFEAEGAKARRIEKQRMMSFLELSN